MGFGRYVNGEYHLVVSFVRPVPDQELPAWRYTFRVASNLLSRATFGQLRFGSVAFGQGALATREADAFIFPNLDKRAGSDVSALGTPGFPMMLYRPTLRRPMVIVHEFAHYALGLDDEYSESNGLHRCLKDRARSCLMAVVGGSYRDGPATLDLPEGWAGEAADRQPKYDGAVRFFCGPTSHPTGTGVARSCWETIVTRVPGIAAPTGFEDIEHLELPWDRVRFESIGDHEVIRVCADAATDDIPYSVGFGIRTGLVIVEALVGFLTKTTEDDGTKADETLRPSHVRVDYSWNGRCDDDPERVIRGSFSDGVGLAQVLKCFTDGPVHADEEGLTQASVRGVILASDGRTPLNEGVLRDTVEACVARRVRIIALGAGSSVDHVRLRAMAERTGGRYERTLDDPGMADLLLETQDFFLRAACDLLEDVGILAHRRFTLPASTPGMLTTPEPWMLRPGSMSCNLTVVPDWGVSRVAIFVLSSLAWALEIEIIDADGKAAWKLDRGERHRGFLMKTATTTTKSPPNFTVQVKRHDEVMGTIEAIVAAVIMNRDVHTAVRIAPDPVTRATSIVVKALRFSAETGSDEDGSEGEPAQISVRLDGTNPATKPRVIAASSEPSSIQDADLWFLPFTSYSAELGALEPGSYPVTVDILSDDSFSKERPRDFVRTHRFQLHVGPGGFKAQMAAPPAGAEPPVVSCPVRKKAHRKKKTKRRE